MTPELNALVEKVARAMRDDWRARFGFDREDLDWSAIDKSVREDWCAQALAAIRAVAEATREPPARIKTATGFGIPTTTADEHWRAMHAASPLGEALRDE